MDADTNNSKNLKIGNIGYIACSDGTFIKENDYEGYGEFNGKENKCAKITNIILQNQNLLA